jgi:hypothetical protein
MLFRKVGWLLLTVSRKCAPWSITNARAVSRPRNQTYVDEQGLRKRNPFYAGQPPKCDQRVPVAYHRSPLVYRSQQFGRETCPEPMSESVDTIVAKAFRLPADQRLALDHILAP